MHNVNDIGPSLSEDSDQIVPLAFLPPAAHRFVNLSTLPTDVGEALRVCNDMLNMDDGELAVAVVLVKRCISTGILCKPRNVLLFVLSVAMIACKLQCDHVYTLEHIAKRSGFSLKILDSAEWFVFGWLLEYSRLTVTPSEYAVCAAYLFQPPPVSIVPPYVPAGYAKIDTTKSACLKRGLRALFKCIVPCFGSDEPIIHTISTKMSVCPV